MSSNKLFRASKLVLGVVGGTLCIFAGVFFGYLHWNTDTEYSEGYSETAYEQIEEGMSQQIVIQKLGEPFYKSSSVELDAEIWSYSKQGRDKRANFYKRLIYIDAHGNVLKKIDGLFID